MLGFRRCFIFVIAIAATLLAACSGNGNVPNQTATTASSVDRGRTAPQNSLTVNALQMERQGSTVSHAQLVARDCTVSVRGKALLAS